MNYVNNLPGDASINDYPYLEIDAYTSNYGHVLVLKKY